MHELRQTYLLFVSLKGENWKAANCQQDYSLNIL